MGHNGQSSGLSRTGGGGGGSVGGLPGGAGGGSSPGGLAAAVGGAAVSGGMSAAAGTSAGGGPMAGYPGAGASGAGVPGAGTSPTAGMPKTLQHYDQHAQDWYDQYFFGQCTPQEEVYMKSQIHELFERNAPYMNIDSAYLQNCIDEHFKNQLEVGTSGGYYDPRGLSKANARVQVSEKMYGHELYRDRMQAQDYEKYGSLMSSDPAVAMRQSPAWYGDALVRFKKDVVYPTTTWTITDSLGPGQTGELIAGRVKDDSFLGFSRFFPSIDSIPGAMRANHGYISDAKVWADRVSGGRSMYLELQYHGFLGKDAIEAIYFRQNTFVDPQLLQSCRDAGIPCFIDNGLGGFDAL